MHYPTIVAGLALVSATAAMPARNISATRAAKRAITANNLTPNGNKAGLSGYPNIQTTNAFNQLSSVISWYSDYNPNTPSASGVEGIGMLWGASGSSCSVTQSRLDDFNSMVQSGDVPDIMFGFYEPDCSCPYSSQMGVSDAANDWDNLLVPLGNQGTVLGSPSMCRQYNEDFLTPFQGQIQGSWDVTSIHINKNSLSGAQKDVDYYYNTYGKPIWVSEFACVDDQNGFNPCEDQGEIDQFINDLVSYFESNSNVVAYGPSNGAGLGNTWPLTDSNGDLTATGQTYLNALQNR